MTHVMIGVIYLGIVAVGYGRGKFSAEDVEVNGLYWHFVDLVWMFVFPADLPDVGEVLMLCGPGESDSMSTEAHAEEAHAGASVGTNIGVWIGLVAITFLEVFLAYEELKPAVMLSILVVLSVVKAGHDHVVLHALEI